MVCRVPPPPDNNSADAPRDVDAPPDNNSADAPPDSNSAQAATTAHKPLQEYHQTTKAHQTTRAHQAKDMPTAQPSAAVCFMLATTTRSDWIERATICVRYGPRVGSAYLPPPPIGSRRRGRDIGVPFEQSPNPSLQANIGPVRDLGLETTDQAAMNPAKSQFC